MSDKRLLEAVRKLVPKDTGNRNWTLDERMEYAAHFVLACGGFIKAKKALGDLELLAKTVAK